MYTEDGREHYVHDANCSKEKFTEENSVGLRTCLECAGIFDENGVGAAIQDKRFDRLNELDD